MPVRTLAEFYGLVRSTIPARRALTEALLAGRPFEQAVVGRLREALAELEAIPEEPAGRRLILEGARAIHVDLSYEIEELQKDLVFVERGEEALLEQLAHRHVGFREELEGGLDALRGLRFQAFVTDRDGTVNNYCGRYASSVQSTYNAVFLARFARACAATSVVLTSAPLQDIGLVDMAVTPPGALVCAGSKGREYLDAQGRRGQYPIEPSKQEKLDTLNDALTELLRKPGREVFTLIGSGLQRKFGQTTVARQDISGSVPEGKSERFMSEVRQLVDSLDPAGSCFRIEDTGLDLEILLTVEEEAGGVARDFDKGDGVRFLNEDLKLDMGGGMCLICGDTASDVPMLAATLELAPETRSIFVTRNEDLRRKVRGLLAGAYFVSEPDILVAMLNALGRA